MYLTIGAFMRLPGYLMFVLLLMASLAGGDVIVEESGRRWTGEIIESTAHSVVIRTDDGLEVRIARDRIAKIIRSDREGAPQERQVERRVSYVDDGRVELAVWGTGYGIFNSILLTSLADGGGDAYVIAMLTGGAVGFATPWIWSKKRDVSDGRAALMTFGGSWGMWQGLGWPYVLADNPRSKSVIVPGVLAGATGIATSGFLTSRYDVSAGDADLIRSVPGWTSAYWLWISILSGA
jgi:hypothetical protein